MISTPNGTARSFASSRSRSSASCSATASSAASRVAAEQEAGVEDDELGAAGDRDARRSGRACRRRACASARRVEVAQERRDRRVDRERDPARAASSPKRAAHSLGFHPEAALEVDLAGRVAALERAASIAASGALAAGHAGGAKADLVMPVRRPTSTRVPSSHGRSDRPASSCSSWTSTSGSPTSGARPAGSTSGTSRSSQRSCAPRTARATATRSPRTPRAPSAATTATGSRIGGASPLRTSRSSSRSSKPPVRLGAWPGGAVPARLVIALSVAAVLAVFLLYTSFAGGATPSLRPSQLAGHDGKVSLAGIVVGPVDGRCARRAACASRCATSTGAATVPVVYTRLGPGPLHRPAATSTCEGELVNGVFVAEPDSLVTKCPSKYAPTRATQ